MKYCHECGYKLAFGTEKHCPECGTELYQSDSNTHGSISISGTERDVIGTDVSGNKNIIAKDIAGNVINLHIENITTEQLKDLITYSPALGASSLTSKDNVNSDVMNYSKATETKQKTVQVLESISKKEKEEGKEIQEIEFGDLKISKNELESKDVLL